MTGKATSSGAVIEYDCPTSNSNGGGIGIGPSIQTNEVDPTFPKPMGKSNYEPSHLYFTCSLQAPAESFEGPLLLPEMQAAELGGRNG